MNQVEHIGRVSDQPMYPKNFACFGPYLLLLADEIISVYPIKGDRSETLPALRLAFTVPLFEITFRNISAVAHDRLLIINELSSQRGMVVHTFGQDLACLSTDTLINDDFADIVCCSVDSIAVYEPPGTFRVLRREGGEWSTGDRVKIKSPPVHCHRLEGAQCVPNEAVFLCSFVDNAQRHFCVVDATAHPPTVSAWAQVPIDSKSVYADNLITIFSSTSTSNIYLNDYTAPALQLQDDEYVLGAARMPGSEALYVLWGDAVRIFDSAITAITRVFACRFEAVICFPLSVEEVIIINFYQAELASSQNCRLLITFAPHILAAV